jgi:hypothetical protein
VKVVVLGEGSGYDEVRCGGVEKEALDYADFGGLLWEVDVLSKVSSV